MLRDYLSSGETNGTFLELPDNAGVEVTLTPARDGDGVIVRLRNVARPATTVPLRFATPPRAARSTDLLEADGAALPVAAGGTVDVAVPGRAVRTIRATFC